MKTGIDQEQYQVITEPLLQDPLVTRSTMMGFPCLRLDGDFFACHDIPNGGLVVKLSESRVSALVDARELQPFAPNGRRFRAWALCAGDEDTCAGFLQEALAEAHRRRHIPQ